MNIRFGPAGLGPVEGAIKKLEEMHKLGLKACEIAFTYNVYIKEDSDIKKIRKKAEELDIKLSIHAQYFVNLNAKEKEKVEASKNRILSCCRVAHKIGAYRVVFHPGFYAGRNEEESYENIKNAIIDMQEVIKKEGLKANLAPETMGKKAVFGSIEQISRLSKETGCEFCIDFAHILARDKKVDYEKIRELFKHRKKWHCHFSGIEYTEKGEKKHLKTPIKAWKELLENLKKVANDKEIVIVNESPKMLEDSVNGKKIYEKLK